MPPKKSFKDNPALQFISTSANVDAAEPDQVDVHTHTDDDVYTDEDTHTDTDTDTHEYTHTQYAFNTRSEIKSRRLQLLIRPSTHEAIARIAGDAGTSVNDVINSILEAYIRERKG